MLGDLFDSPWKILIVAIVIIVLFGSRKLPDAARSLGKSMRILKTEVQSMHEEEPAPNAAAPVQVQAPAAPLTPVAPVSVDHQAQIDALSRQLADLQQTVKTTDNVEAK
jgi:sec-independent protein translocase protein TatA